MGTNKKKQDQLRRLFHRQGGRCWWCKRGMIPRGQWNGKGRPPPLLCTYEHMDDRFSDDRGKHAGEYRNVAACWECNNRRAQMQQAMIPKAILHERSKRHPRSGGMGETGLGQRPANVASSRPDIPSLPEGRRGTIRVRAEDHHPSQGEEAV